MQSVVANPEERKSEPGAAPELDPSLLPLHDLRHAVTVALARDGALLTAGEVQVARAFLDLPQAPGSLFARLLARRPAFFRLSALAYAEVPEVAGAAQALIAAGLAWSEATLPVSVLAEAFTVPELKAAAAALGRPTGGLRAALLARVSDAPARPLLSQPGLLLRHRGLFRRLCRLYLHDHDGDLSRLVVARLGLVRYPDYAPTGGGGLFPDRRALLGYETARRRRDLLATQGTEAALLGEVDASLAAIQRSPLEPDYRRRFSARRFHEELVIAAARCLERRKEPEAAEALYSALLAAGVRAAAEVCWRRAFCLEALGRGGEAAALCQEARDAEGTSPELALSLDRTGRRLAKASGVPWVPLPPLTRPVARAVPLPEGERIGARPGWGGGAGAAVIEEALAARLAALGRRALYGENALWTTLFGLLFREVLFAPVPGMLPSPLLTAPLDLGFAGFAARRRPAIQATLEAIAAGEAAPRLEAAWARHAGEAIAGVRWDLFRLDDLKTVAEAAGAGPLAAVLRLFAEDWRGAVGGLPDLAVLPGPPLKLPGAHPATLPEGLLLVEVKGPTDSLRDGQRVWLDRLIRAGLRVELWQVRPEAAGPAPAVG